MLAGRRMVEWILSIWPIIAMVGHALAATAVTLHAVLRPRQSKAAVAWIGLAWMAPFVGGIAYLGLGINRIERKGEGLGFEEARRQAVCYESRPEDVAGIRNLISGHPTMAGLMHLGRAVTGREVLSGNTVVPLCDGDEAFPAMLEAIEEAEVSVALMTYIFDSDRVGEQFCQALVRACERGVAVRVLIDHVGSRYSKTNMVGRLRAAGVPVAAFLPPGKVGWFRFANLRLHRKILVVDGRIGFTGGTNIREAHCLGLQPRDPTRCLHFRLEGPVVMHLHEAFGVDWTFTTGERLDDEVWFRPVEMNGPVGARGVSDGPDEDIDKMEQIILGGLAAATKRVRIVTPYFLPDEAVKWALAVAALRDVTVEIVIPAHSNLPVMDWATMPQLAFLLEKHCRIYQSPKPFDHSKIMVVDGIWSLIGSTNWDARSLRLNFEYNIECYDAGLAAGLEAIIDERIAAARPVTLADLEGRGALVRLRDGLAQLLSPYL